MMPLRLLAKSIKESGFGRFMLFTLGLSLVVFIFPLPLLYKLIILFVMNFFIFLATVVMYVVLVNKYLSQRVVLNFLTLGLTFVGIMAFSVYALSFLSAANNPAQVSTSAAQAITPYAIMTTLFSNYLAWILLGVAYEGSKEAKFEGFDSLFHGTVVALVILKALFIAIALALVK